MENNNQNTEKLNFYCPLTVKMEDDDGEKFVEVDVSILGYHEDVVRAAVIAENHSCGEADMSEYFDGNEKISKKLNSVLWDVKTVEGELFGCIRIELAEPLTDSEKEELRKWIVGQCSDGIGEGFEQRPVETSDGELFISFWDSDEDWFLLDDEEFEQHLGIRALTSKEITTEKEMVETVSFGDLHISPDFQCDTTNGYPTVMVWNKAEGTAILQQSPAFDDDSEEAKQCLRDCANWGVRPCANWQDYNDLLESIGEEAFENAAVPLDYEDEDVDFAMGGLE